MGPSPTARWLRRRVTIAVLSLGLLAVVLVVLLQGDHPGGDAGNRVFTSLTRVPSALPHGATSIVVHETPAQWLPACSYMPASHAGWGEALVRVEFNDIQPVGVVVADINRVLVKTGWQYRATRTGPGQGPIPRWIHPEPDGQAASVFAYQTPAGSTSWFVTASWQPPGPIDEGCP